MICHLLNNQITHVTVDIYIEKGQIPDKNKPHVFAAILLLCTKLNDFTFFQQYSGVYVSLLSLNIVFIHCMSQNLTKLTINVNNFDDCLYLLNGNFPSLSTLIICIQKVDHSSSKRTSAVSINVIIEYKQTYHLWNLLITSFYLERTCQIEMFFINN